MKNIPENEMININGGGIATQIYNATIVNFTPQLKTANIPINSLKESTIRNLTNKFANSGYVSTIHIHETSREKYLKITKRQ